ncbi:MAG: DUF2723 domain-containing protein [Muribaculaceae bacterium]|nr:DUF2723 domain-containing protein [Muribaculaceae bacterium]
MGILINFVTAEATDIIPTIMARRGLMNVPMKSAITYGLNYMYARRLCAWGVLCVALLTYLLTTEPTASYWDCPEYIAVGTNLEVGHPPGNPLWMLAARFFVNFAPTPEYNALMINIMSCICAALTIMVLFLTIEYLARKLVRPVSREGSLLCLGAGVTGALAFCWSDSLWFSAVEAEVYAFSTLCTALMFWISLLYYEHRTEPHADRYLILLAYLTGLTLCVHELNLLCIPTLVLMVAFGARKDLKCWRIVIVLLIGLASIAIVLYGLIPGFMALAEMVEIWCVNGLGMSFNSGLLITVGVTGVVLITLGVWLNYTDRGPKRLLRAMRLAVWSIFMILLGFSCYALIMIRAAANAPLDTGHPADIISVKAYFHRDQYGSAPLVYGAPFSAQAQRRLHIVNGDSTFHRYALDKKGPLYVRGVKGMPPVLNNTFRNKGDSATNARLAARSGDWYQLTNYEFDKLYPPELCMWFPRMHSHNPTDVSGYYNWLGATPEDMYEPEHITRAIDEQDRPVAIPKGKSPLNERQVRPTYLQNLQYFAVYQMGFMYWRYFFWNYFGRQNDYTGHGEPDAGNVITGIDPIDRLVYDVAADAPANVGRTNKGRNVYYALPLVLGLLGIVYQLRRGKEGRRQALLVTTLFILTGVAIVVYLNQAPAQARDRDYSFLGSWYSFSIWIGLGTLGVYALLRRLLKHRERLCAYLSVGLALCVPLQTLSQTYDDHDRSGRTATRDTAYNMLQAVDEQGVIFSSQDNNIFPLWYLIEAEGMRPDVRVISSPYMSLSWYPAQWLMPMRESRPIEMTASPGLMASDMLTFVRPGKDTTWTPAVDALKELYINGVGDCVAGKSGSYPVLKTPRVYFVMEGDTIRLDLGHDATGLSVDILRGDVIMLLDMLATNAASKHPRPFYWTRPLGEEVFNGQLKPYMERIGTILKLNPKNPGFNYRKTADLALRKFKYGTTPGVLESGKIPYFDPVAANNIALVRTAVIEAAHALAATGKVDDARTALALLERVEKRIPPKMVPYQAITLEPEKVGMRRIPRYTDEGLMAAQTYLSVAETLGRPELKTKGLAMQKGRMKVLRDINKYINTLRPQYRPFVSYRLEYLNLVLNPHPLPD